jgi:hypothetical protein
MKSLCQCTNHLQKCQQTPHTKANSSLAKEPRSTQCANKRVIRMLDTIKSRSPVNCQRQMQACKCQSSKKLLQQLINELLFDGTLDDWKN